MIELKDHDNNGKGALFPHHHSLGLEVEEGLDLEAELDSENSEAGGRLPGSQMSSGRQQLQLPLASKIKNLVQALIAGKKGE